MSEQAREYLIGFLESVFNAIQGVVNWIVGVVQSIANWIWSGIQSMFIDPIQKAINTLVERFVQRLDRVIFFALGIPATMREAKRFIDRPSLGGIVRMAFAPVGAYIASQILAGFFRMSMGAVPSISYPTLPSLPAVPTIPKYEYVVETYSERADIREEVSIKAKSPYMLESVEDTNANDVFSTALVSPQSIYESESASTTEEFTTTLISPVEESYSEDTQAEDEISIYAGTKVNMSTVETADAEDVSAFSAIVAESSVYGKLGTNDYQNRDLVSLDVKGNILTPNVLWSYAIGATRAMTVCCGVISGEKCVCFAQYDGYIRKLKASDGSLLQERAFTDADSCSPALWDVDKDGELELLFNYSNATIMRCIKAGDFNVDKWTYSFPDAVSYLNIADVDGDGNPEIVVTCANSQLYVLDGNGNVKQSFSAYHMRYTKGLYDIDGDGKLEFFSGNHSADAVAGYDDDGSVLWSASPFTHDPIVIEDVDGDGIVETFHGRDNNNVVYCRKLNDGSLLWTANVDTGDDTGGGYGSAYDFDGDGIMEVIFGDDTATYMFKGTNGSRIWKVGGMCGAYLWEVYGIACDVDGDDKYEFLGGGGYDGYAYDYYCVNTEDGSILWTLPDEYESGCQGFLWDVDGDGIAEFILGTANDSDRKVRCFKG